MKFEDLKSVAVVKNPKTGSFEMRETATGKKFLSEAEKKVREDLQKSILGDEPLGPALEKAIETMDLDEIILEYPDDIDAIVIEAADLVQSGLVKAMNPLISREEFAKNTRAFERIVPQMNDLATMDRAKIIDATHQGGLVDVMVDQEKFFTPNQRKILFDMIKTAADLAEALRKKPEAKRLPEEQGVIAFVEQLKENESRFSAPIKKAIGEAFASDEDETETKGDDRR